MDNLLLLILWSGIVTTVSASSIFVLHRKYSQYKKMILQQITKAEEELLSDLKETDFQEFQLTSSGNKLIKLLLDSHDYQETITQSKMPVDNDIEELGDEFNQEITETIIELSKLVELKQKIFKDSLSRSAPDDSKYSEKRQ